MKILHITGDDFSAMSVEKEIGIDKAVQMTHKNGGTLTIDTEDFYAELKILTLGEVDPAFIRYIKDEFIDYDTTKGTNFYVIGEDEIDE